MNYELYSLVNYGLPLLGIVITFVAQIFVTSSYHKYKEINNSLGITGFDVARKILDKFGLQDIKIIETQGNLTDHYDPTKKVVKLSTDIYHGKTIAAASVAAHECGHAIQHKVGYLPLKIRSFLVPFVNFSTKFGYIIVMIGLIFGALSLAKFGIILLLAILLFQLVTLPVEFNASSRAKVILKDLSLLNKEELSGSKTMLRAAAMTYVASLMTTLLQILRLALMVLGRRDDR